MVPRASGRPGPACRQRSPAWAWVHDAGAWCVDVVYVHGGCAWCIRVWALGPTASTSCASAAPERRIAYTPRMHTCACECAHTSCASEASLPSTTHCGCSPHLRGGMAPAYMHSTAFNPHLHPPARDQAGGDRQEERPRRSQAGEGTLTSHTPQDYSSGAQGGGHPRAASPFDWPRRSARCCTMASATPSARRARCASSHGPYDWRATASKKSVRASSLPVRPRSPNMPRDWAKPLPPSSASSAAAWSKASSVDISWSGLRGEGPARSVERGVCARCGLTVRALWVDASCGWVDCELWA
eukprot:scaffold86358_cov60-Phaeocystis_antarctica.AAC.4